MARLASAGRGKKVGPAPGNVVPIVPAAIVNDLGRGGDFACRPGAEFGQAACDAAMSCCKATRRPTVPASSPLVVTLWVPSAPVPARWLAV